MNNPKFVLPKTFLIGYSSINMKGMMEYLTHTDQTEFLNEIYKAKEEGLDDAEVICSFYAKACYASLTDKKNKNISRTRDIYNNIISIIESQHGSVLEHCNLNFITTDCSRVYTHEVVRHRVGTAMSQTSGRYVRGNDLKIVHDPILDPVADICEEIRAFIETKYKEMEEGMCMNESGLDFNYKKKVTSAMRRYLPNGQANEMGWSVNIRTLRQTLEARTSRHAEWEIRIIFNQIFDLVKDKYKAMFIDVEFKNVDGINEITFKNKKI